MSEPIVIDWRAELEKWIGAHPIPAVSHLFRDTSGCLSPEIYKKAAEEAEKLAKEIEKNPRDFVFLYAKNPPKKRLPKGVHRILRNR